MRSSYFYSSLYGPPLRVSAGFVVFETRAALSKYHVHLVIVDTSVAGGGPVLKLFEDALGRPRFSTGKFYLWSTAPRMIKSRPKY